jgi:hypothetical protein
MRTNVNPGAVKHQVQCSCGVHGRKHWTDTVARLGMVAHLAEAELTNDADGHHASVVEVFA